MKRYSTFMLSILGIIIFMCGYFAASSPTINEYIGLRAASAHLKKETIYHAKVFRTEQTDEMRINDALYIYGLPKKIMNLKWQPPQKITNDTMLIQIMH